MNLVSPQRWGAQVNYDEWPLGDLDKDKVIVHYGGGPQPAGGLLPDLDAQIADEMENLRTWERWHLSKGWRGLGYAYVIGQSGAIYRGRSLRTLAAHRGDLDLDEIPENREAIGVAFLLGGDQRPSGRALLAFEVLLSHFEENFGPLPLYGHKEVGELGWGTVTECPGEFLMELVVEASREPEPAPEPEVALMAFTINRARVSENENTEHPHVRIAQGLVASQGFKVGPFDGVFGPKTAKGVKAFQKDRDLKVDGIVGSRTWSALEHTL